MTFKRLITVAAVSTFFAGTGSAREPPTVRLLDGRVLVDARAEHVA